MRCFYCGSADKAASEEHIPSAYLGSRLKTRKVCKECNKRANEQIDQRMAESLQVRMPKARGDVRSIRRQSEAVMLETDGIVSTTGDPVKVRFTADGREARRAGGELVRDVVEIRYGFDSDLWLQFIAKVALGCATKLFPDAWLDERVAKALQSLLWHGPIDTVTWPAGIEAWPGELNADDLLAVGLGHDRHLVGFEAAGDCSVAFAILFGGEITCKLPLPGTAVPSEGAVWILDWHPGAPPRREGLDQAIERMLRERGWSTQQIDAVRVPAQ
jgi:HNH endonuclease